MRHGLTSTFRLGVPSTKKFDQILQFLKIGTIHAYLGCLSIDVPFHTRLTRLILSAYHLANIFCLSLCTACNRKGPVAGLEGAQAQIEFLNIWTPLVERIPLV